MRSFRLAPLCMLILAAWPLHAGDVRLSDAIAAAMSQPSLRNAAWAIDIEDDRGNVLYGYNANTLMMPGSNRKIFAAAAAVECLGLDRRFTTELWLDGPNLVLRGGGDPSLGGRYAFSREAVFAPFVDALRRRGIREIAGDLIADVSLFDRTTLHGRWKLENVGGNDHAPVDALAYNENVVGVWIDGGCRNPVITTDPPFVTGTANVTCASAGEPQIKTSAQNEVIVTGPLAALQYGPQIPAISDPALYAAQALRDALHAAGIEVRGTIRVNGEPRAWHERIAAIDSPPLYALLPIVLKNSQNLYTEMLFKSLAADGITPASYAASQAREREFLTGEPGLDGDEFRFVDGSGLATDDYVSPAMCVRLFRWLMTRREVWWNLLATPGEEGTLHARLLPLASVLRGKTGTIAGVNTFSGVIDRGNGRYRFFSIMINHHLGAGSEAIEAIDSIVTALAAEP